MFHVEPVSSCVVPPIQDRNGADELRQICRAFADQDLDAETLLERVLGGPLRGEIAAVSAFGAESVLLLAMIAEIDRTTPVLFLETGRHFPETVAFRAHVAERLGLTGVRDLRPLDASARDEDPTGELWYYDADACCALRKVRPLERGLSPFRGWITGRKRHQSATRADLASVEISGGRLKINPLVSWTPDRIEAEIRRRDLPRHPLAAHGYRSIGCAPCTRPVTAGENARAGRWHGSRQPDRSRATGGSHKTECGIHRPI